MATRPVETAAQVEMPDLRALLADLKEVAPSLARDFRRDLRATGDDIIAQQRSVLSGEPPQAVQVTGKRLKVGTYRNKAGKLVAYKRIVNTYGDREGQRRRSRGLRENIKSGLRTRVVAGKTRSGINIRTTGPTDGGYNMARVYEQRLFRHPVFGTDEWAPQRGLPYFWGPVYKGRDEMHKRVQQRIDKAVKELAR